MRVNVNKSDLVVSQKTDMTPKESLFPEHNNISTLENQLLGWVAFLCTLNYDSIVNWLYSNIKLKLI